MRISITEWGKDEPRPVILEGVRTALIAVDGGPDDEADHAAICVAYGDEEMLTKLAASILLAMRDQMGDRAFLRIVRTAWTREGLHSIESPALKPPFRQ